MERAASVPAATLTATMGKRSRRRRHLASVPARTSTPLTPTPVQHRPADALISAIASGEFDGELARIRAVVIERAELLRKERTMAFVAELGIGDRVRIDQMVTPKYLRGALGTVTGWAGQKVVVRLDRPIGRFETGEVRCPPDALEPAPPA